MNIDYVHNTRAYHIHIQACILYVHIHYTHMHTHILYTHMHTVWKFCWVTRRVEHRLSLLSYQHKDDWIIYSVPPFANIASPKPVPWGQMWRVNQPAWSHHSKSRWWQKTQWRDNTVLSLSNIILIPQFECKAIFLKSF